VSSYETRRNHAGDVSHRIRFRHDGRNVVRTFASEDKAQAWKALLDATTVSRALAALEAPIPTTTRSVAEQVANHIAHLTGVTDGTRSRYAGYLDRRIGSDPLGRLPLAMVDRDACAAWVNRLEAVPLSAKTIRNHHSLPARQAEVEEVAADHRVRCLRRRRDPPAGLG
jgi:hypothetical protein